MGITCFISAILTLMIGLFWLCDSPKTTIVQENLYNGGAIKPINRYHVGTADETAYLRRKKSFRIAFFLLLCLTAIMGILAANA